MTDKNRRNRRLRESKRHEDREFDFDKTPKGERRNRPRRRIKTEIRHPEDYQEDDELEEYYEG